MTCPGGETSTTWIEAPSQAPYTMVKFASYQCNPCRERSQCTRSKQGRTVYFLPRHLHELQAHNRSQQQDAHWLRLYGSRAGVEGTMSELVNGHSVRRCRYQGLAKTHVQHTLTAIAINVERLAAAHQSPGGHARLRDRIPEHSLPIPRWWRRDN
ncbi:transposase [Streptomyces sp. DSM 44917]|uniref:Transposase n=1 Tax=Streptomyces boetiae TaxID=3075541 RepID=A0ABU2LE15_9ACTN|nr:transposase [Streptomyces sp. DSM 44917]MDT0309731.1 transposase [Streptomyces sp. DSM 44917]